VCVAHAVPEGEVRTHCPQRLDAPTAKNCVPDQVTPFRSAVTPEGCEVHVNPVGELRMVPLAPTVRNCVPDQVTPVRAFTVPEVCDVHADPVGEARMVPLAPTATNCVVC
jgi:hypothetical protein